MIKTTKSILVIFILVLISNSCTTKDEVVNYDITTSVQPQEAGKVTPSEGSFPSDTDVTIVVTANEGFVFKNWAGASVASSSNITLMMDSHKQLTAIFEKLDSDDDGVSDDIDACANTPAGETVDENGCSNEQKDADGDGVTDDTDNCPDTIEGEIVDENGCSDSQKDTDGDGVTDDLDQCQNTPTGAAVDSEGCSATQTDTDGDTITDDFDQCPNTTTGETVDSEGCSASQKDTDGDGVADDIDICDNTLNGDTADESGCSNSQKDTDGDGVTDDLDQCQNTTDGETVDAEGCSANQFDTDGDTITDDVDECPNTPSGEAVNEQGCSTSQIDTDGDGVTDDKDQCENTDSEESVDENGCSPSQADKDAPVVTDLTVTEITPISFTVDWSLDENSKGYIQIGTSSGSYSASTVIENNFVDRHLQTVGGNTPLDPNRTYYWRIYVEDQYGNTGFSEEQTTTTLAEVLKTYVPDDLFEQKLIDQGYDDVLDNYVNTANIDSITILNLNLLVANGVFVGYSDTDFDFTGLQDFKALEELSIEGILKNKFTIPESIKRLDLSCSYIGTVEFTYAIFLETLNLYKDPFGSPLCQGGTDAFIGVENAVNLKHLKFSGGSEAYPEFISSATYLETLYLSFGYEKDSNGRYVLDLTNNTSLREISFDNNLVGYLPDFIKLKNGANEKLELISIIHGSANANLLTNPSVCIETELPLYIASIISSQGYSIENFRMTENCGY